MCYVPRAFLFFVYTDFPLFIFIVLIMCMCVYLCVEYVHVSIDALTERWWASWSWSYSHLWAAWYGFWEVNSGSQQEQPALLPAEPSLQPWGWHLRMQVSFLHCFYLSCSFSFSVCHTFLTVADSVTFSLLQANSLTQAAEEKMGSFKLRVQAGRGLRG